MFSSGLWGSSPPFDIADLYDEYFHCLWVANDGLDGSGDWIDRVQGFAATPTNSPSAAAFGDGLAWDFNGTDQYFSSTDVINEGIAGFIAVARNNSETTFATYEGIITEPFGGQTALIGNAGGTGLYRIGSMGDGVTWDGIPTDHQANGFLPCGPELRAILVQRQFLTAVTADSGLFIGRDRSALDRFWNGQIAVAGALKKTLPTDLWERIMVTWAAEYGFMHKIHPAVEWKGRQPVVQSSRPGRVKLNDGAHHVYRSVRTRERSSGARGMPDVPVNHPDVISAGGVSYVLPSGSSQSNVSMDLTDWTPSGGIEDLQYIGDDTYSVTVSGAASLTYDLASDHTGNKCARCLVRTVVGYIPENTYLTFYNDDTEVGSGGVMAGLGQTDWDLVDVVQAGTNDQMRFEFPAEADCTIWLRKVRSQLNYLQPFPAPYRGTAVGTGSGTDSSYIADYLWPSTAATVAFLFKPYGGWFAGGTGPQSPPAGAGTRVFSAGNWHLRGDEDPVLRVGGVDSITASGGSMISDWQVWWFDYDTASSEIGLQCGANETRYTYTSSENPSSNMYIGNESAVNQLNSFVAPFFFDRVVSQPDRLTMENEMIRTARAANIKEQ